MRLISTANIIVLLNNTTQATPYAPADLISI